MRKMKSDHGKRARECVSLCLAECPNRGELCESCFRWSNYNGLRCELCDDRISEGNVCKDCYEWGKYVLEGGDDGQS